MEYRRCQPPCARFIASDDPHSKCVKCLGFSHAREAVYGISNCIFCENLRLRTLRSRLEVFEKESSVFTRRALEVRMLSSRLWRVSRQASSFLSLPLPSTCARIHRLNSRMIIFILARDNVSFGLDDILLTAASDSEDFGPALEDALPPSGQEARPYAAYSELVDMLSRATEKLSLDWPDEPCESRNSSLNSTSGSLSAQIPYLKGGSCRFSVICIKRSPDPGSRLFPPALPTRQPLTSPTLWVLWSRATPPFLW